MSRGTAYQSTCQGYVLRAAPARPRTSVASAFSTHGEGIRTVMVER